MTFVLESKMYSTVLEHLPPLLLNKPYACAQQVPLVNRIVDIGFAPMPCSELNVPEARSLTRLKLNKLWLLAEIVTKGENSDYSVNKAADIPNIPLNADSMLSPLIRGGIIHLTDGGKLVISKWLVRHLGPVIMVELKLTRWRDALQQALFYLTLTDKACVVLDGDKSENVSTRLFEEKGVGLFVAWQNRIEMLVAPGKSNSTVRTHKHFNRLRVLQDLARKQPQKWYLSMSN